MFLTSARLNSNMTDRQIYEDRMMHRLSRFLMAALKHVAFIRIHAPCFISLFARVFIAKPVPTFARHALAVVSQQVVVAISIIAWSSTVSADGRIPMIDAHSQIDHLVNLDVVLPTMDRAGISRVIHSTRGKRKLSDIVQLAKRHPDRITASMRLKGRIYEKNRPEYHKRLQKMRNGRFGGMAEALIWHAKKGKKARQVKVALSAPQVQAALKIAKEKGWPFIVHIEFAAAGKNYAKYMNAFENFLREHPNHPMALIHMGQLQAGEVARLIDAHQNIYFLTSHANPIVVKKSNQPWVNLFSGQKLKPDWIKLIREHSDRFILAFDNVWAEHWGDFYVDQAKLWQKALHGLPPKAAYAVAHGNAERLWRLASAN